MKTDMFKQSYIFLIGTLLIVSCILLSTVNRDWQMFDEKDIYYNESLYPIPANFPELFEIISTYAPNFNFESQNLQFSNIVNIRSNPIGATLNILISYLFKKNSLPYHLLSICIHILNTLLVWLIFHILINLKNISRNYNTNPLNQADYFSAPSRQIFLSEERVEEKFLSAERQEKCEIISADWCNYLFTSIITLIWALHPVNIEPIMMSTNWNSVFTYSFYLLFFLHTLKKISTGVLPNSKIKTFILALLFFVCVLMIEYSYIFPIIILFTSLAFTKSIKNSFTLSLPYFLGLVLYIVFYFVRHFSVQDISYQTVNFSVERFLWFSPQIFIHFLKLFFYPKDLSVYQSNLVLFASSYFEPYAIFSFFIFISFLILPFILFIFLKSKAKGSFAFLLICSFIFSVFPFLHILAPTYCIFAKRYCYFPLFLFLFFITALISSLQKKKTLVSLLILILLPLSVRTIFRLNDWKDSYSLYSSAVKAYKPVYKGFGYAALGYYFNGENNINESRKYFLLSIKTLESGIDKLKNEKTKQIPETLRIYGLDTSTLILNAAFRIASIRFYDFHENTLELLKFYEPYIESNIHTAGSSQLDLYAKLLLKTNQAQKALEVLRFAKEKYPFSTTIIFSLSNFYLNQKDLINAEKIIQESLAYYPNYIRTIQRTIKFYWLKNDLINLAKYEYLLGLRIHSQEAYQKALQIYLLLGKQTEAKRIIDKLFSMDKKNPVTLLLASKYYSLTHEK